MFKCPLEMEDGLVIYPPEAKATAIVHWTGPQWPKHASKINGQKTVHYSPSMTSPESTLTADYREDTLTVQY